jgi:hypothetical protein
MLKSPTLDEVLHQARKLSPLDKLRLIERVAPDLEKELAPPSTEGRKRSLLGLWKDLGPAPSAEEIDEVRREAWSGFDRAESS